MRGGDPGRLAAAALCRPWPRSSASCCRAARRSWRWPVRWARCALAVPLAVQTAGRGGSGETSVLIAPTGGVDVTTGTLADGLAGVVALMVAGRRAAGPDLLGRVPRATTPATPRTPPQVSLFTAAMLAVVLSARPARAAGRLGGDGPLLVPADRPLPRACRRRRRRRVKAFLVTRVGDVGFLLGILLLGVAAGTFRITDVLAAIPDLSGATLTTATLLLLLGVAGKSAQFPLHTWLPDAMAGPTPISALIHAATMVAAGVYVVLRLYPPFEAAPVTLAVLGLVAAITMPLGALAALRPGRPQAGAGLVDGQPARVHAGRAGGRRHRRRRCSTCSATPRSRRGCSSAPARCCTPPAPVLMSRLGGLRRAMPVTYTAVPDLRAGAGRRAAAVRWAVEGRGRRGAVARPGRGRSRPRSRAGSSSCSWSARSARSCSRRPT